MKKYIFLLSFFFLTFLFPENNIIINTEDNNIADENTEKNTGNDINPESEENNNFDAIKYIKGEEEIPEFKKLDDNKTFLFLDGFWESELNWTIGLEFFKDYTISKIQSPIFFQKANLSLLLFMYNRWYFDVNYREKLENVALAAGYINIEDEIKKHIRLGNSGIKFPAYYPFIKTGGGRQIAPGIIGQFGNETWQVDTVIRYESSEKNKKIFLGKNEVTEQIISISAWERAKYFLIPADDLYGKQIEVIVKDSEYGGWHILTQDKYTIDNRKNILMLKNSFPYGVAINIFNQSKADGIISRTKNYFIGTDLHGLIELNPPWITETVNGKTYFKLKEHNMFSCFEIASIYNASGINSQCEINLTRKKDNSINKNFSIKLISTGLISESFSSINFMQIIPYGKENDYSETQTRFPLRQTDIHIYLEQIDNNHSPQNNENNTMEITAYNYNPISDFVLPKEANSGDIEVIKNGIPIIDFFYNEYTHIVSLKEETSPSDRIEIRWSENKNYSDSGIVKTAAGLKWHPLKPLDIFLAASADIDADKNNLNTKDKYNISTGFNFKQEEIKTGIHFGIETNVDRYNYKQPEYIISRNHLYFEYERKKSLLTKNEVDIFSNALFHIDGDINKNSKNEYPSLHSHAEAGIDIWKIHLGGKISVQDSFNKNKKIIESYGHNVKIPLYFFYADESFFVNTNTGTLSRTNKINFEKYIHLSHLTFINYDKELTEQKITSTLSPIIPSSEKGSFFIEAGINLNQKYKTEYNISDTGYTNAWQKSLIDLYSQGVENAKLRNEKFHFIFNWFDSTITDYSNGFHFSGFNFDSHISADNNENSDKTHTIYYSFRLPMSFKNIFITPLWERQGSKILKNTISKNYKEDFNLIFRGIEEQPWFFSTPIFFDFFDKKILSNIQSSNTNIYVFFNTYGLEMSRLIYYDIKDIYIPTEFSSKLSRIIKSDNAKELGTDYYRLAFTINYLTLNLSGKNGFLDWFKTYEQDELNRNYKWSFDFNKNIFIFNFKCIHKLYFYLQKENKIGFENIFDISAEKRNQKLKTSSWNEDFSFLYIFEGNKSMPKMLLSFFTNESLYDEREEKLTVSVFKENAFDNVRYKFAFKHTQKTKIGRNGEIKIFAGINIASTKHQSVLLNLTLGIAGKVEY